MTDPSGTTTYTWNARNQLVSLNGPNVTANFQHDALGRRLSKTLNSATIAFLYDGLTPVQELASGTPTANLLTGLGIDEYLTRTDAAGFRAFLADGLGSTLALADNTGTVQTEYTYEPFGNTTVSGASSTNAFQYTGRESDGTGLYYYRARYYHPVLQRFISEDPIGFAGGDVNLYGYVGNDPTNWVDPEGLFGLAGVVVGGVVGGVGGGVGAALGGAGLGGIAAGTAAGAIGGAVGGAVGGVGISAAVGAGFGAAGAAFTGGNPGAIAGAALGGAFGGTIAGLPGAGSAGIGAGTWLGGTTGWSFGTIGGQLWNQLFPPLMPSPCP